MPLFDLRCQDCQSEFVKMTSFARLHEVTCPTCDSTNHERIYKANIKGPVTNTSSGQPTSGFT